MMCWVNIPTEVFFTGSLLCISQQMLGAMQFGGLREVHLIYLTNIVFIMNTHNFAWCEGYHQSLHSSHQIIDVCSKAMRSIEIENFGQYLAVFFAR